MGKETKIQWCDHTLNFWWGCQKVGLDCVNCYAESLSKRFGRNGIWGPPETTARRRTKGPWLDVLRWDVQAGLDGVRRKVFCQSMSDFFEDHPQVNPWRDEAWPILEGLENLDVLFLTKRPENISRMIPDSYCLDGLPRHFWFGTSAGNQETLDARWPVLDGETHHLRPAVLFLSLEPLLGPVDLDDVFQEIDCGDEEQEHWTRGPDYVVVGGESGPGARPCDLDWLVDVVAQCREYEVPVFVKQVGDRPTLHGMPWTPHCGKLSPKGGEPSEWPSALRVREWPR